MVVASHAKCRQCGGTRHKTARLNLCKQCWERVKPEVRRQWRDVKERRAARRKIDAHVNEHTRLQRAIEAEVRERAAATRHTVLAVAEPPKLDELDLNALSQEQAAAYVEQIKEAGLVPPPGPGRGRYMLLHKLARGGTMTGSKTPTAVTQREQLLARLYIDTDVPVAEIKYAARVAGSGLTQARQRTNTPTREDMFKWNPRGHKLEDEELVVQGLEAFFRHKTTGQRREIWPAVAEEPVLALATDPPVSEEVQQQAREAFEAAVAEPVEAKPAAPNRRKKKHWTPDQRREIATAYNDLSIPYGEITAAWDVTDSSIIRFAADFGVPLRRMKNRPAGRILNIDGKWTWKSYDEVPDEVAEETPVQQQPLEPAPVPAEPLGRNGFAPITAEARPVEEQFAQEVNQLRALAVPPPPQIEHAWYVRFTVTQQGIIGAASFEDVGRRIREQFGEGVEIIMVQRA